jgi:hypothetical protein
VPTATPPRSLLRDPRGVVRRTVRRHRRPLAAALAGIATLVALTALRGAPAAPATATTDATSASSTPVPGQVTVPVALASGAIAAVLRLGDVIDLVGATDADTTGSVIVRGARVVGLPDGGSALGGSSSAVILVVLPEADALRVVTSMGDGLTPMIRSR